MRPVPTCVAVVKSMFAGLEAGLPPRSWLLYAPVLGLISQTRSPLSSATHIELSDGT